LDSPEKTTHTAQPSNAKEEPLPLRLPVNQFILCLLENTVTKTPRHLRQLCPFGPPCDSYRRMRSAGGGCGFRRPAISQASRSRAKNITANPITPTNTPHTKPNCTSWFQNSAHVTCLAITGHPRSEAPQPSQKPPQSDTRSLSPRHTSSAARTSSRPRSCCTRT